MTPFALLLVMMQSVQAAGLYSDGHGDIGVAYEGAGSLELHWHLDDGAVVDGAPLAAEAEFEPGELVVLVPTTSNFTRSASPAWNFVGNAAGATTYLLPESDVSGVPYIGFGSEELTASEWESSSLNWTISSFSGPGQVSLFTLDSFGSPTAAASTFENDLSFTTTLGGHSHFNIGFTEAGVYDIGFTVSGTHLVDGLATDTQVYRFNVAAVPEPGSIALALVGCVGAGMARFRRRAGNSVAMVS